jgi:ZIP family zinc transporter
MNLIPQSIALSSVWLCALGIILGSFIMLGLDILIPHMHPSTHKHERGSKLNKMAFFIFMGMFLHNFPEGMAIGIGSVSAFNLSLIIAIAIMVHDIPETMCTAIPYYYATKKRLPAFLMSFSTVIPTVAGLTFAYFLFDLIPLWIAGMLAGLTAGLMIYISAHELIPATCSIEKNHATIFSLISGVIFVVLLSLL